MHMQISFVLGKRFRWYIFQNLNKILRRNEAGEGHGGDP